MRVLAKPELENAVILNEFAMIMENFGVLDQMDEDNDDYISDTEASVAEDTTKPAADEAADAARELERVMERHTNIGPDGEWKFDYAPYPDDPNAYAEDQASIHD